MKKTVSFFCVGVQKSGTTTLHNLLGQYTELFLPIQKESKFFVDDSMYNKGYKYYHDKYFNKSSPTQLLGEVDPEYIYFSFVAKRLYEYNPEAKIIMIFRNPIDRAYSHYRMSVSRGFENLNFLDALQKEQERLSTNNWLDKVHYSYADRGFYAKQLSNYLNYFPKEQILVLSFVDLVSKPEKMMREISNFLNVIQKDVGIDTEIHKNPATKPRYVWLSKILHGKNLWRRRLSSITPSILKKPLVFLRTKNQITVHERKIPDQAYLYLKSKYEDDQNMFLNMIENHVNFIKGDIDPKQ